MKAVLLGESSVGKSSIIARVIEDKFYASPNTTIGAAFFELKIETKTETKVMNIWDTAGQERFAKVAPLYYRTASVVIVVFAFDSEDSFIKSQSIVSQVRENSSIPNVRIIVMGNKCDLPCEYWKVTEEQAQQYCYEQRIKFHSVSAKNGGNLRKIFENLALDQADPVEAMDKPKSVQDKGSKQGCC